MRANRHPFAKAFHELIFDTGFNSTAKVVCLALRTYFNEWTKEDVYPSRVTIAKRLGYHVSTIDRAIKQLVFRGYIVCIRGQKGEVNRYKFPTVGSRANVAMTAAEIQIGDHKHADDVAAQVRHKQEPENKNHEQDVSDKDHERTRYQAEEVRHKLYKQGIVQNKKAKVSQNQDESIPNN